MADTRVGRQSPHDVGTLRGVNNSGPMNASITEGSLPSITTASTGLAAITSTKAPPGISPDTFQQGINITATANLTSLYQLSTPMVDQDPKVHSEIVSMTPGAPYKTGRDRADHPGRGEHSQREDEGISGRGRQDRYQTDSEPEETHRDVSRRDRSSSLNDSDQPPIRTCQKGKSPLRFDTPGTRTKEGTHIIQQGFTNRQQSRIDNEPEEERDILIRKLSQKEVSGIHNLNDEAVVAVFTNNLQKGRLSFDLRRECQNTYANLMDVAGSYEMAEEEELAQRGSFVHGGSPRENAKTGESYVKNEKGDHHESDGNKDGRRDENRRDSRNDRKFHEDQKLVKYPPRQLTYARSDMRKYCRFHKESGHNTSKCYQLRVHIQTLIREGHLKDLIHKRADDQQKDPLKDNQPRGNQEKKQSSGQGSDE
ncbi:hypothetical protein Dsin_012509 [Dipteronia sinensis]|uniref:Retrotransposon gag domain-containing protein n=1 Tax=Dipteronia sinensis TaxID=43782 RepID=A0AAE0AJG1_9ROSI|nr:hypothetical protein Dsin_012509 [Dipteronia sinensis]